MIKRDSWEFVTEEAATVEEVRTLKNKVYFTYFNPNGAYAVKKAADDRISAAVDAGLAKGGAIWAYGSFNDYHYTSMNRLAGVKRPRRFEVNYMIEGLLEDAAKADEFLATLKEEN
jgi:hypothetical protein